MGGLARRSRRRHSISMGYETFDDIAERIRGLAAPGLIAIDGLPVSGKSTLADFLSKRLELDAVYLDDFVLPERLWPADRQPAFPFGYIRYADFMAAVVSLATSGAPSSTPSTGRVATSRRPIVRSSSTALSSSRVAPASIRRFAATTPCESLSTATGRRPSRRQRPGAWATGERSGGTGSCRRWTSTSPPTPPNVPMCMLLAAVLAIRGWSEPESPVKSGSRH